MKVFNNQISKSLQYPWRTSIL